MGLRKIKKKRVFIIHGWEATPVDNWFPWLKEELLALGFEVSVPAMPNTRRPKQKEWLNHLVKIIGKADEQTFLVGHSLGVTIILQYLEKLPASQKIGGAILVAGPIKSIGFWETADFFSKEFNFKKIKQAARELILIYSDNDPLVPLEHGKILQKKIGAKFILIKKANHLCEGDGFFRLPMAREEILRMSK